MSGEMILFLVLGALSGGFINGLAGTATGMFALGFFLLAVEPVTAVALVTLMSMLAGIQGVWLVRKEMLRNLARLMRFAVPGLVGVPVGVWLLGVIDADVLRLAVAALLILYGGYFGFRATLPAFSRPTPVIDGVAGGIGGVLGGMAGISGAIPTLWTALRPWTKMETRAVVQSYNMAMLITTVCLLFAKGAYDRTTLNAALIVIPTGLVAAQVGIWVFGRLSDTGFRRLLILLTLLMGLGTLLTVWFG